MRRKKNIVGDLDLLVNVVGHEKTGKIKTAVFDRANIQLGTTIKGPAIIESLESTLVIPPNWTALMDPNGFIILSFGRFN